MVAHWAGRAWQSESPEIPAQAGRIGRGRWEFSARDLTHDPGSYRPSLSKRPGPQGHKFLLSLVSISIAQSLPGAL